jgi:ring-1,2-phenylacetyl-CoA epoxidase subunit PaaC
LVEQTNGDFGKTMMRQFFFDAYRKLLFERLLKSSDVQLAAIADKSLKETKYHLKHSSEWMIRLGDGTDESHSRIQDSLDSLWKYTNELFFMDEVDFSLIKEGIIPSMDGIQEEWLANVKIVLEEATLTIPTNNWKQEGGRIGKHTEHLGFLLAELQYMQRAYPNMKW